MPVALFIFPRRWSPPKKRLVFRTNNFCPRLSVFASITDSSEAGKEGHVLWMLQKPPNRKETVYQLFSISGQPDSTQACTGIMIIIRKIQ